MCTKPGNLSLERPGEVANVSSSYERTYGVFHRAFTVSTVWSEKTNLRWHVRRHLTFKKNLASGPEERKAAPVHCEYKMRATGLKNQRGEFVPLITETVWQLLIGIRTFYMYIFFYSDNMLKLHFLRTLKQVVFSVGILMWDIMNQKMWHLFNLCYFSNYENLCYLPEYIWEQLFGIILFNPMIKMCPTWPLQTLKWIHKRLPQ